MDQEAVYREYKPKVMGYLYSRLNNPADVEDLCSDIFVKVFSRAEAFDSGKASVSTWIYAITRNTLIDFFRTHKIASELNEEVDMEEAGENSIEKLLKFEMMKAALAKLEERERDVIILHYYDGLTLKEISDDMGISYRYVKTIHAKALLQMREALA